jgi:phytoene desaturase
MGIFQSVSHYVRKRFKEPRLRQILEFPVLFLGASPKDTPSLYTLMNHADFTLGTWYPDGGFMAVARSMESLAKELGAKFHYNHPVKEIIVNNSKATGVRVNGNEISADVIIGSADYHHVEQKLLPQEYRRYSGKYWDSRDMAPSALMYYLGFDKPIGNLLHHNLFFDESFDRHAADIYDNPTWPENPLLYVSATSKTDKKVAPEGHENVVILIPVAPDMVSGKSVREQYLDLVLNRMETLTGDTLLRQHLVYQKSYAYENFLADFNSYKGNAYGLSNTLRQTAIFKPSLVS